MKLHARTFGLPLGVAFLLFLVLLISPWSPSSQSSFSLALDLDTSEGDQAVTLLEVVPGKVVSIQIFGVDMQKANGISLHFGYDATEVVYLGFEAAGIIPNALMFFVQDSTSVRINASSLSGSATANAGLVGTVRFRTTSDFSDTEIWLVRANLTRGGRSETVSPDLGVALQAPALSSPDFNGSGVVDFADFVLFAGVFGYREGDEAFDARYDLNIDNGIGFEDFVIFARSFGEAVNRAPVFAAAAPVTRSLAENASGEQLIGDPISATDADGDALNYRLRGRHAASFAIDAGTGQLRAKEGITYDHEAKDSYYITVRASDGKGGRASLGVNIAVTDVDEPPVAPPQQYVVEYGDGAVMIRWIAPTDEAGKPPVSGYEVQGRQTDSDEWEAVQVLDSRADTSLTLTDLISDETYQVRVRTLNEEGSSEWSAPIVVTLPTSVPPPSQPPPVVSNDVCNRTAQVGDAIVAAAGVSTCGDVTAAYLSAITELSLVGKNISILHAGDFSGLSALKTLNLNYNNIGSLPANIFSGLSALKMLHLSDNGISNMDASLFSNLSSLEWLNLSGNDLANLDADFFSHIPALTRLWMDRTRLNSPDTKLFSSLSRLRQLTLSGNGISSLDPSLFSGLSALETLWLRDNNLTVLPANLFSSLSALRKLEINNNELVGVNVAAFSGLAALEELWLGQNKLHSTSLPAGVFGSLARLRTLELRRNQINSLPAGIFPGLTSLTELDVSGNPTDPLPITISLELTAAGQFRASAHTGAPFEMTLSLQVVNGTISSGATSIVIPRGRLQSDVLTVTRTAGTTAAVTVDIVSLPALPLKYSGLTLVKSADLPLQVIAPSQ